MGYIKVNGVTFDVSVVKDYTQLTAAATMLWGNSIELLFGFLMSNYHTRISISRCHEDAFSCLILVYKASRSRKQKFAIRSFYE